MSSHSSQSPIILDACQTEPVGLVNVASITLNNFESNPVNYARINNMTYTTIGRNGAILTDFTSAYSLIENIGGVDVERRGALSYSSSSGRLISSDVSQFPICTTKNLCGTSISYTQSTGQAQLVTLASTDFTNITISKASGLGLSNMQYTVSNGQTTVQLYTSDYIVISNLTSQVQQRFQIYTGGLYYVTDIAICPPITESFSSQPQTTTSWPTSDHVSVATDINTAFSSQKSTLLGPDSVIHSSLFGQKSVSFGSLGKHQTKTVAGGLTITSAIQLQVVAPFSQMHVQESSVVKPIPRTANLTYFGGFSNNAAQIMASSISLYSTKARNQMAIQTVTPNPSNPFIPGADASIMTWATSGIGLVAYAVAALIVICALLLSYYGKSQRKQMKQIKQESESDSDNERSLYRTESRA